MSKMQVNFLPEPEFNDPGRPKSRRGGKKIIVGLIVVIIISLLVFSSSVIFSGESLVKNLSKLDLFQQMGRLIASQDKKLDGENDDRVNFLIMGQGGKNHEGGTLADTIILASYKPSANQVAMMSIPRDTQYCEVGGGNCYKINAISAFAEQKKTGAGGEALAQELSKILGMDIHYYMVVDFAGFEKIIDEFGGVDIEVENDLVDYEYPIRGKEYVYPIENRYEKLVIKAGIQQMDGALALKYARSRHALGPEGSDFARAKRQQKIIMALKEKIFTIETFVNPKKINNLLTAYNEHIKTNLAIWEMLRIMDVAKKIDSTAIIHQSLTDGAKPLLYSAMINGSYVLLPTAGNFDDIKNVWQYIFYKDLVENTIASQRPPPKTANNNSASTTKNNTEKAATTTEEKPINTLPIIEKTFKNETAKIEIRNGTWINGYANQEKTRLEALGLKVIQTANADNHEYAQTVIYDLAKGKYPATARELEKLYEAEVVAAPAGLISTANFVIILGQK
ncbi:LCP family protein [Candidatus Falkowbacteria bacterium]|nr:LCP family protein [Candidatus Falkowbacteria bacterium]